MDREVSVMYDKTMTFSVNDEKDLEMKRILTTVYDALSHNGYNPLISQHTTMHAA